ncbi:MAG: hypothetical protein OXT69_12100 [Candidatus Poribacteria bacterium]|nr:hypothetical protein [Candidatus Poribacteria bacterium]
MSERDGAHTLHEEKMYSLRDAAQLLNMTEAALRMRIKRNSIQAEQEPMGDPNSGRYKLMIPQNEMTRLMQRLEAKTQRGESTSAALTSPAPAPETQRPPIRTPHTEDVRLEDALRRIDQMEQELRHAREEREMMRQLIQSMQTQFALLEKLAGAAFDRS